jgi:hypothetical protein
MRDYGKVHSTFWSSPTTSRMSDDGKLLALYLMTCQHNTIAGVFRLPSGYVAEDLGWDAKRVTKGFAELFSKGFATQCEETKWVWVTKHLTWNPPENPNQRKAAQKIAQSIPSECVWKQAFMRVCGPILGIEPGTQEGEEKNPSETLPKEFLNQEQEQEQEQEQKKERARALPTPEGVSAQTWADWLTLRKAKKAPVTATVVAGAQSEAQKAGMSLDAFLRVWCSRGSQGLQADWLKPAEIRQFSAPQNDAFAGAA